MFIRNCWYVTAWSDEVNQVPFGRRILDEPVVLFRTSDGGVATLEDRCCHRGAPLSLGHVCEDGIQCGYHGLVFDGAGECVMVPGGHRIPPGARVRRYPTVEKDGFIWIWMGDPARAKAASIIDYPWHNDEKNWPHRHDVYRFKCDYLMVVDNLMDLSHLGYVHTRTVGGTPLTHVEAKMRVQQTPSGVRMTRWMLDSPPPPTYVKAAGFKGLVDRCQDFLFFAPNTVHQWTGAVDAAAGAYEPASIKGGFAFRIFHGITPETASSCFYFWSVANNYALDEPNATRVLFDEVAPTFKEDQAIVEGQQARFDQFPDRQLVQIHGDGPMIQARRAIERMLAEERAPTSGSTASVLSEKLTH